MKHLIEKFYSAFANCDAETMVACYHEDIEFEDSAFGQLTGSQAGNMWRMLCATQQGKKDFRVEVSNIKADDQKGTAHWESHYTFSQTGRQVFNKIDAAFEFKDGKIIKHIDRFNLYKWSSQALGLKGTLIGWSSFFKNKLHLQTAKSLARFEEKMKSSNV